MLKRIELVPVTGINSSYTVKRRRLDVSCFNASGNRGNFICPDMAEALKKLKVLVEAEGGNFYITDLFRSWKVQAEARQAYETGKKKAFVAKPGGSFHTAGRAVDIAVKQLNFPNVPQGQWLEYFWEMAIPLGFHPIIKMPDLGASESWHYDFAGVKWEIAYGSVPYSEVAKACTLDVGEWDSSVNEEKLKTMFIQAQLVRLGMYNLVGKIDGVIGPKTKDALDTCDILDLGVDEQINKLKSL